VLAHPLPDCMVSQVSARFLAHDPLESLGFLCAALLQAQLDFRIHPEERFRGTRKHQDLRESGLNDRPSKGGLCGSGCDDCIATATTVPLHEITKF
jgi:hypothetical protein